MYEENYAPGLALKGNRVRNGRRQVLARERVGCVAVCAVTQCGSGLESHRLSESASDLTEALTLAKTPRLRTEKSAAVKSMSMYAGKFGLPGGWKVNCCLRVYYNHRCQNSQIGHCMLRRMHRHHHVHCLLPSLLSDWYRYARLSSNTRVKMNSAIQIVRSMLVPDQSSYSARRYEPIALG